MAGRLKNLLAVMLIGFAAVALAAVYWGALVSDTLLRRGDNPRLVEAERALQRGAILATDGTPLAFSTQAGRSPSGLPIMERRYPHPETAGLIGYYSLTYGVGGIEGAYDAELRGSDRRGDGETLLSGILHQPPVGSDIRLTLDVALQKALADAFGTRRGAGVVLEAPTGALRAMVSLPGFNPEMLDSTFDALTGDPGAPLLNRAIQGRYQPGGALQSVILAALLSVPDANLERPANGSPVLIERLSLTCAEVPTQPVTTLLAAYAWACPGAFLDPVLDTPGAELVWDMAARFGLTSTPVLDRLEVAASDDLPALPVPFPDALIREALGQGELTVTPLQMALAAAIIANDGKAVTPYLVESITAPTGAPTPYPTPPPGEAVITIESAAGLRQAMQAAVTNGAARLSSTAPNVYGHASIAYTGATAHAWYIGFLLRPDGRIYVIAVVVEETDQAGEAARIAGTVWQSMTTP